MNKKVILITGGSDGLGLAVAESLSTDYRVVILGKDKDKTQKVASDLAVDFVIADITKEKEVTKAIKEIIAENKRIDVLINNAGAWIQGPIDENDSELLKKTIEVNTYGTIMITKHVVSEMKKQKSGQIVNVISQGGLYAKAERSVYTASKWAITGFTKSLQDELGKFNIAVSGFYPGPIQTKFFEKAGVTKDTTNYMKPADVAKMIKVMIEVPKGLFIPELGIKPI